MRSSLRKHTKYFVGSSLITFLFCCMMVMAIGMLLLGVILQYGSLLAPWLLSSSWTFLSGTLLLFAIFRCSVLIVRMGKRTHHWLSQYLFYRDLLTLSHGTVRFLLERLRQVLFL